MSSKALQILATLGFVLLTGWAHARVPIESRADLGEDFVPAPYAVDAASLGFDALLADYYWLQAVQVAGAQSAIDERIASHLGRLVDVTTTLNPHVSHPYRFAAVWMTHSREQVLEANRLLERATRFHPEDWRNHFYLGFNHFYYLGNFPEAASALEAAMALDGAPGYLPRLVARLKSETGDIDVAEVFLREMLESTEDEEERAKYETGLDEIEIEQKARFLDRARSAYRALTGRDIERVEDLVTGPHRVIEKLPDPEPDAIPDPLRRGSVWEIEGERIVSSYLGSRYEVHYSHQGGHEGALYDEAPETTADEDHAGGEGA
ncbi:MAG: hypothetical protein AAGC67_07680 [Myxococcota bacterium]